MGAKVRGIIKKEKKFSFPFRILLCGSSGSGKTFFAGELLKRKNIFDEEVTNVSYFYPWEEGESYFSQYYFELT